MQDSCTASSTAARPARLLVACSLSCALSCFYRVVECSLVSLFILPTVPTLLTIFSSYIYCLVSSYSSCIAHTLQHQHTLVQSTLTQSQHVFYLGVRQLVSSCWLFPLGALPLLVRVISWVVRSLPIVVVFC
jgi:hypothetical protein